VASRLCDCSGDERLRLGLVAARRLLDPPANLRRRAGGHAASGDQLRRPLPVQRLKQPADVLVGKLEAAQAKDAGARHELRLLAREAEGGHLRQRRAQRQADEDDLLRRVRATQPGEPAAKALAELIQPEGGAARRVHSVPQVGVVAVHAGVHAHRRVRKPLDAHHRRVEERLDVLGRRRCLPAARPRGGVAVDACAAKGENKCAGRVVRRKRHAAALDSEHPEHLVPERRPEFLALGVADRVLDAASTRVVLQRDGIVARERLQRERLARPEKV